MTDPVKQKRRTPSEMKASLLAQVKVQEEREKAEVVKLISDAHDTIAEAAALEAALPHKTALLAALIQLKNVLTALAPKP